MLWKISVEFVNFLFVSAGYICIFFKIENQSLSIDGVSEWMETGRREKRLKLIGWCAYIWQRLKRYRESCKTTRTKCYLGKDIGQHSCHFCWSNFLSLCLSKISEKLRHNTGETKLFYTFDRAQVIIDVSSNVDKMWVIRFLAHLSTSLSLILMHSEWFTSTEAIHFFLTCSAPFCFWWWIWKV